MVINALYVSLIFALNIKCSLDTCVDWHQSGLNWDNVVFLESEDSIFKDYGIESEKKITHKEAFMSQITFVLVLI